MFDENYIGSDYNGQPAFLSCRNVWDQTVPSYHGHINLEYIDLDEFLKENGMPLAGTTTNNKEVVSPVKSDTNKELKDSIVTANGVKHKESPVKTAEKPPQDASWPGMFELLLA